jgi:light-regulated signal transduction histidine kinase (bacteriophytochrome)
MVASYTQLLARRYKDKLDEPAQEFIGFAVSGAQRMQAFIQDLLRYSRVGTRGRPFERLDLGEIVGRVLENLRFAINEKNAEVTVGELPSVEGDRLQLTQLFQNLISNALKFSADRPLKIDVKAVQKDGVWEFTVSDNGIGLAPEDADRIFVIFQRLHTRQEYEGTGIGLAISKKIVERHGGRIWVESRKGEGATFHFTLPEKEEGSEPAP